MILSRLNITNGISQNTPHVVLSEIAETLCIQNEHNVNRLILKIHKNCHKNIIKEDNWQGDIPSLRIIARYVNCLHKSWKKKDLLTAFNFLCSFEKSMGYKNLNFTYGRQTPDNIYNLNACVLYRLCKDNGIHTSLNTTMGEMATSLRYLFHMKANENNLKMEIYHHLKFECSNSNLINIINLLKLHPELSTYNIQKNTYCKRNYTYIDYEKCAEEISRYDDESIQPKNNLQAIVMAALYYKLDIRKCENPIHEYTLLCETPYFPHDENLKHQLKQPIESLDNPYINENFKRDFPPNMYTHRDLIYLCGKEGLYIYDETHYSSLQEAYLTENFLHGKQGNILNTETTFLENISDLHWHQIVVYGIRAENNFTAFTYAELCDTFSSYKRFMNPRNNQLFSEQQIEKLFLLAEREKRSDETEEIYKERIELAEEIERIKIYMSTKDTVIKDFVDFYENLVADKKEYIEKCLHALLNLGMYMRNWDGESDYPLNVNSTNFSEDKQIVVDDRVTQGLITFENLIKGELGKRILNLPLMQYHKESNMFVASNDPSEGLTIQDRIKIVRGGENENMSSCIRMSSNKLCATSYYYMVLIGFRLPFNISEIHQIT